jgi:hypothetical protein
MSSDFNLHIVMNEFNYNVFIDPYGSLNVSEDDIFKHGQYTDNLIFLHLRTFLILVFHQHVVFFVYHETFYF